MRRRASNREFCQKFGDFGVLLVKPLTSAITLLIGAITLHEAIDARGTGRRRSRERELRGDARAGGARERCRRAAIEGGAGERRSGLRVAGAGVTANFLRRPHRLERTGHHLRGARAVNVVDRFGFEQLGVREDDPQLIVQAMEQEPQLRRFFHGASREKLVAARRARHWRGRQHPRVS